MMDYISNLEKDLENIRKNTDISEESWREIYRSYIKLANSFNIMEKDRAMHMTCENCSSIKEDRIKTLESALVSYIRAYYGHPEEGDDYWKLCQESIKSFGITDKEVNNQ